jgi:putative PIG3 family NAD(P)H quinone oxidoreductase
LKRLEVEAVADGYRSRLIEVETPTAPPGEVLVRVAASGLNRADLSQIAGRYPAPPGEPGTLGLEISGTVVGSGEKVCALLAGGGHADHAVVPVGQMFPAPSNMDLVSAAAIPEAFLTAFLNLVVEGNLRSGGRALVHAGASGVGLAAIQVARHLGASVAATTRTAAKIPAIQAAGAELAIDTSVVPFADAIRKAWGPDSVDVVLDPVGADTLDGDLAVLAREGRVIFLATMSGAQANLDIRRLMGKRGRLIGSTLRSRSREAKAALVERFRSEILPAFERGALSVSIDSVYRPDRASEAFLRMKENRSAGKILIDWTKDGPVPGG